MLSSEGNSREPENKLAKRQLCTCSTLFCTFLCRCFARLQLETSRNFQQLLVLRRKCRTCSRSLFFFTAAMIFTLHWWPLTFLIFSPPLQNFYVVLPTKKRSPLLFISVSFQISVALILVELRLPTTYFLCFSVFLLLYFPNLWT